MASLTIYSSNRCYKERRKNVSAKDLAQKLYTIPWSPDWEGIRLKEVLRMAMPELSSRDCFLLITKGLVASGEDPLEDADHPLITDTILSVDLRHGVFGRGRPAHPHLHDRMKVYHDDAHIVVVSKRAGTVVQPIEDDGRKSKKVRTAPLIELLKHYWKANEKEMVNPQVIQRLDLETSGLLVLGKTTEAGRHLQRQLKPPRKLRREYLALVEGVLQTEKGVWKSFMGHNKQKRRASVAAVNERTRRMPPANSKYAETHFEVVERMEGITLLRLRLETGRTHQIRIHCAEAGHPVMADPLYTSHAKWVIEKISKGKLTIPPDDHPFQEAEKVVRKGVITLETGRKQPRRMALHATKLTFFHPYTKKKMTFEEPLPQDLVSFLDWRKKSLESKKPTRKGK
jgi:23S rRNA pseudouridine1911/1915/1917 synthase